MMEWLDSGRLYSWRTLALCGLPLRRPGSNTRRWRNVNGRRALQLIPHRAHGVPFGQDRLVFLLLATLLKEQGGPALQVPALGEVLRGFGLAVDGRNYARFRERFQRVLRCTLVRYFDPSDGSGRVRSTFRVAEKAETFQAPRRGLALQITPEFRDWILREAFPISRDVVLHLASSPANLDFYQWLVVYARSCRRRQHYRVPLWSPGGLQSQLAVDTYSQSRDFRRKVGSWLRRIREVWPSCPANLSLDRSSLLIYRGGHEWS